jgi:hypothetical protein
VSDSAYFFPLNADVALFGLRATIAAPDGPPRVVLGKVLEKEAARKGFSKAVSEGRSAALIEVRALFYSISFVNHSTDSPTFPAMPSAPKLPKRSIS